MVLKNTTGGNIQTRFPKGHFYTEKMLDGTFLNCAHFEVYIAQDRQHLDTTGFDLLTSP